ncbi:MAG: AsmA family protein, partial [Caldimonas sp.]
MAFVVLFDWDWLRPSLNRYITRKTQREFTSAHLAVKLGLTPTIQLRGVTFANAPGAGLEPMAQLGTLEFSVSLRDLFDGKVLVPRAALTDATLRFARTPDGRKNWVLSDANDRSPSRLRISSLSVTRGNLHYADAGVPFVLDIAVNTFDPAAQAKSGDAGAPAGNTHYTTRYAFQGKYHDASFSGEALTGDVLSFQESGINFPLRGHLAAGTTRLDIEGTVADAAEISAIDVRLKMSGATLANIYPFLLLPLPATPPYRIEGHLTKRQSRFELDEIRAQLGATDITGSAAYVQRQPRPLLQAKLHSDLLVLADLGPLVGINTKANPNAPPPTQAETRSRATAQAKERQQNGVRALPAATPTGERLLPTGKFEGGRLKAIDADVQLVAQRVKAPERLEVANVRAQLQLHDGVLALDPFSVDFAGGRILANIHLDARQPILDTRTDVRFERLELAELLPSSPTIARSKGRLDARVVLHGRGDSIADAAAKADGRVSAVVSRAQISNLLDAAAGLNGGKVIQLLVGGDQQIAIRCGAAAFDVRGGQGRSTLFVIDTEQSRIDGSGTFDLDHERFDAKIEPQPKHPGIFSLRTPVRVFGSFRHPDYALDKTGLALRAGGAIA